MESVKKAKERLRKYPLLIAVCHEEGAKYAACVIAKRDLKKNACEAEFKQFKACLVKAAARHNTRL